MGFFFYGSALLFCVKILKQVALKKEVAFENINQCCYPGQPLANFETPLGQLSL